MKIALDLIIKVLEDTANPEEKAIVIAWRQASQHHEDHYQAIKSTWNNSAIQASTFHPNIEIALKKVHSGITRRLFIKRLSSVAAILIVSLSLTWFLLLIQPDIEPLVYFAKQQSVIELADGSKVTLASGSTLSYPKEFNSNKRIVELKGKAYFEIAKHPGQTFLVQTLTTTTKVLGTKFTLNTYENKDQIYLDEGKVLFKSNSWFGNSTVLTPGEKAQIQSGMITKTWDINENHSAWASDRLKFKDVSLKKLVSVLEKHYQTKIHLAQPEIEELRFTGSFTQQSLVDVLEVIALTLQLKHDTETLTLYL